MKYSENWDLESIFPGGTASKELQQRIALLQKQLATFKDAVIDWSSKADQPEYLNLSNLLVQRETIVFGLNEARSFVNCWYSADTSDKNATILLGSLLQLSSQYATIWTIFTKKLVQISQDNWEALLKLENFEAISFVLNEIRKKGNDLLSEAEEALLNALNVDGIQAWDEHYTRIVSLIQIPFEENDGSITLLSAGQAQNKMLYDPDSTVRERMFHAWEKAWSAFAPLFADTLNHLAGARLADYQAHGISDFLKEPLSYNRMTQATLDTMWSTIEKNKAAFLPFFERKAKLLGKDKLAWQDVAAPVIPIGLTPKTYTFDEGADFIIENFAKFGDKLASFTKMAFEKSWIEAEDRPGKRPGGYCTNFPETGESRIFMTYSGSPSGVSTLAHELGHAFHGHVMRDIPAMNRAYAMNVAETASTFAEMIVADATVKEAQTTAERINLLDSKLENATTMFFNIHARFIFECNFYEARKNGVLSENQISELMVEAQKESYLDILSDYHPHFWASKLHFYKAGVSFYNFPYTFGYLFSLGIYARSLEEGKDFEEKYIALLRDTASMTTEDLAQKHLGVDLQQPEFWQAGIDLVLADVQTFLELTEQ